jgi:three-Cys-motif partner protein
VAKHVFGGDWTGDKLERVRKYLCAYMKILKKNVGAGYFTTVYVDAFAGTGQRVASAGRRGRATAKRLDARDDSDAQMFQKGSARIALEVEPAVLDQLSGSADLFALFRGRKSERCPDRRQDREGHFAVTGDDRWPRNRPSNGRK